MKVNEETKAEHESMAGIFINLYSAMHAIIFCCVLSALYINLIWSPSYKYSDVFYSFCLLINAIPASAFILFIFLFIVAYILMFGFISLIISIRNRLDLLNQNLIDISVDTIANIRSSSVSRDSHDRYKISRKR